MSDPLIVFDLDDTLYLERDYALSGYEAVGDWMRDEHAVEGFAETCRALLDRGQRAAIFDHALARHGLATNVEMIDRLVSIYRSHTPRIALACDAARYLHGRGDGFSRLSSPTAPRRCNRQRCGRSAWIGSFPTSSVQEPSAPASASLILAASKPSRRGRRHSGGRSSMWPTIRSRISSRRAAAAGRPSAFRVPIAFIASRLPIRITRPTVALSALTNLTPASQVSPGADDEHRADLQRKCFCRGSHWKDAEPRKVLHTITSLNVGGAQLMLTPYLEDLGRTEYASTVLSLLAPGVVARRVEATGTPVLGLGGSRSSLLPAYALRLPGILRRVDPDLIHGWMYHGNFAASVAVLLGRRRTPVIWGIHHSLDNIGNEKRRNRLLIRLLARLSSTPAAITYCSRVAADQHERLGFDPARRVVIPNGMDSEAFTIRPDLRHRLRDSSAPGRIVSSSAISRAFTP